MSNYLDKSNQLIQEKKFEEAKVLLETHLNEDTENAEALKLLGLCFVNLNYIDQAIDTFEKVTQYKPEDATSWYYLATLYDQKDNFAKSENAYKQVISLRPEYVDALKSFAILYLRCKQPQNAKIYAQKASELDPLDYQPYYMLGTIAISDKDFKTAIINYEKAISFNQSNPSIFNSLGAAYFAQNRLDDAIKMFNHALLLDEENALSHYHMGNIAQIRKQYNEAFEHFKVAYSKEPSTVNLSALAYSAIKAKKYEDAEILYKTLSVIYPEKQNFQYNFACAQVELKKYKEAIPILKKLVTENPKSATMAEKLAEVYAKLGELQDAKNVYERLIKKGKISAETYYRFALICIKAGSLDRATKIFKKALELEPENAEVHKNLGVIYLKQRLFDYAQDEFETALKLAPDDMQINFEFANYLYATADYIAAKALYERVTANVTNNASYYFYQGLNYLALNELENAQIAFEKSRNLERNDLNTYHLARTNYYTHNFNKAKELLEELETQDIDAQNLMALTLYELEKYQDAIAIYNKILEKFHENINIMLSLAKCYIKVNNKEEALKAIIVTLERYPDHEEALSLLKEAKAL